MKLKILLVLLLLIPFVIAWTPQSSIDLRNFYNITNVPYYNGTEINITGNITANYFKGNGSLLTDLPGLTDTNTNCSVANTCSAIVYEVELNKSYVDTQDSAQDACNEITNCVPDAFDNVEDIPNATPSDGDTTHLSTADQIYDWIIGFAYTTIAEIMSFNYYNASNFSISNYITSAVLSSYNYYNASNFTIADYSTTAEIIAFGYYNDSDFVITDYFTKTEITDFGYYNASNFSIGDYFTGAEIVAFNYYNSSNFSISDYVTSAALAGYNYYNASDFSISDYYTQTQVDAIITGIGNFSDWDKDYNDLINKPTVFGNTTDEIFAVVNNNTFYLATNPDGFITTDTNETTRVDQLFTENTTIHGRIDTLNASDINDYDSLGDLQTAVSNDFHNLGGVDIDTNLTEADITAFGFTKDVDTTIGNCSIDGSCPEIVYASNTSWVTENQNYNTTEDMFNAVDNATFSKLVDGYIEGQPIDGSIGSGVIWSDDIDSEANVNLTVDGLDITYPNVLVRLVTTAGATTYCNITSGTETLSNNIHYVFYVDSDCTMKNTTFSNYMDTALSPGGQTDIFNALAVDDTIEVYKGITIANKETIKVRKTMLEIAHLNIISGMDLKIDTTFPEIYQNTGEYLYIRTVADTSAQNSTSDGIHQVGHVSGDWVHVDQTGINLTHCDNGTDLIECATNVFRRYIIYTVGRDDGTDTTGLHMLAPLTTDQTHVVLANCLNTVDYPISYTLPSFEDNAAVVTYAYCGKRDDADWQEGWIDLRRATGGAGALPDTSNFLTKDLSFSGDVSGLYNALIVADYSHLLDWANISNKFITAVSNIYLYMSGTTITLNETKLNATIDAREYNTNCSVAGTCSEIVYNTNTSWITSNQLFNTTDEIFAVVNNDTFYLDSNPDGYITSADVGVYDLNITNGSIDSDITNSEEMGILAGTGITVGLSGNDFTITNTETDTDTNTNCSVAGTCTAIVYNTNTSWITANQGYNTTAQIFNAVDNNTFLKTETVWLADKPYYINSTNTTWITANQGYNTTVQMFNAVNNGTFTSLAQVLAFSYYNASNFVITDYFTSSIILGFGYYNASDFDITDYSTTAEANDLYNDTTYTAGSGLGLTGTVFSHNDSSSQADEDNSGRTYIQDILLDTYGHILTLVTATETVTDTNTNCSVSNSCSPIVYEAELNKTYVDTQDSAQDECSEITGCVEEAFNSIANFTGTLTSSKWCLYDGSEIDCNVEPVTDTDTNLTEDNVEAYIFDADNTANLGMNSYNITGVECIIFDSTGKICTGS